MHFVIVGNGVAGVTAALTIRSREPDAEITVVSGESEYFFSRTALMYAYMDRLQRRDLEPYERSVYDHQRIRRVKDWVTGLDANSRRLRLQNGGELRYDRLLLATGSLPNRPAWKGLTEVEEGVVHFVTLADLDACERLTKPGKRAVVVGGGLIGVELVECFHHHKLSVTFLVREPWYWPAALGVEEGAMISAHIEKHGVHVVLDETVEEILHVKGLVTGVRTASGHTYECDLLGITIGVHPAVEWLARVATPPRTRRGIVVGPDFRTSLDHVWAAGDCAEIELPGHEPLIEQIWYSARRQGELAALSMLGDLVEYRPRVFYNSSKFFEVEYTTVGKVNGVPDSRKFYARMPGRDVSVRIVEQAGAVTGFNMLGSRWNHTVFERWIAERRSLDYCLDHLAEAQFDVEFGRVSLDFVKVARAVPAGGR
jgi:NADPH-dependent 2,4-dienoyl-CoA reductase/sulfur reductase-like enzyme